MRRRLRLLAATVGAAAAIAGCTSTLSGSGSAVPASRGGPSSSGAAAVPPLHFGSCDSIFDPANIPFPGGRGDRLTFGCAKLGVPLDWAHESGSVLNLELVRVHDERNRTGRALVVNPGGPGGSGFEAAVGLATEVSDKLLQNFDLVGFDPRGVGFSSAIRCLSDQQKDAYTAAYYDIRTPSGFAAAKQIAAHLGQACSAKYGARLADFTTVQTAKDMDRIRAALGESRLDYLGFSYGTELGGVYAHLFPKNVGATVLDGAVDPLTDDIASFADQLAGFESAFDQFAADCTSKGSCSSIGDPRQAVYAVVQQATGTPIPSGDASDHRTATVSLVLTGVIQALYSSSSWGALATALHDARDGRSEALLRLADEYNQRSDDGTYSNILDANTTIACNDSPPGPSDATIRATTTAWAARFPMFGLWAAQSLFTCQQWQPHRDPVPKPIAATRTRVLVIGNLHDPATPYQGAKDLAKTLGNAEVLTWDGEGHTSYLGGSKCVDNFVDNYLISGTLPPDRTTCPR